VCVHWEVWIVAKDRTAPPTQTSSRRRWFHGRVNRGGVHNLEMQRGPGELQSCKVTVGLQWCNKAVKRGVLLTYTRHRHHHHQSSRTSYYCTSVLYKKGWKFDKKKEIC
jgi:hypothetical protein